MHDKFSHMVGVTLEAQNQSLEVFNNPFCSIEQAIAAIAEGKMLVVVDDEDRENEGDLVMAADFATPAAINFMISRGRGLVCLSLTRTRAEELGLTPMVSANDCPHGTAFTVSVDGTSEHGVTTGISAFDRATTIRLVLEGQASDLRKPGHMFPLVAKDAGVIERQGHTEASVDLARLAGLRPAGVIVEIIGDDGEMLRGADLVDFARRNSLLITTVEMLRQHILWSRA